MAYPLSLPAIINLFGKRCLFIPPGGSAEIGESVHGGLIVLSHTSNCVFTEDGFAEGWSSLWPGAVPERLHPYPLINYE